jgi:hypothetical protein
MRVTAALLVLGIASPLAAQEVPVRVDGEGVMRWTESGAEVALFGVNYTTPFAYAYRAHGYVGADRKKAIDADVAHLARLGVGAYRIHMWDREISDRQGNLRENDHLDLMEYLVARLLERDIRVILTPIFHGGPGYPERNPVTEGFSEDYSKGEMTVNPEARRAQRNYFTQLVRHVNPYTGRTLTDEPGLLAIEIFNEPSHPAPPPEQTAYISEMAGALREAGFTKPILYNISIGWSDAHARAVCSADIQGVTFQWYPSGLVRNSTVRTNMLPNVDRYPIPFIGIPECRDKARLVYEFDAADVMGSYLYPAMARAFRGAGMQWATQFAYDPMAIAQVNTEYQTHYLNLVYTPAKAISFLIAGEAFRRVPRGATYGTYPESARFGPFRVDYAEDLSEMVTDEAFYHSNGTSTAPPTVAALRRVAGTGSSPLVDYEGSGAYFLDRLEDGVWRLEVYPDVVHLEDPFGRARIDREVGRLLWREWPMRIVLPDLGTDFSVRPVNPGNAHATNASGGAFPARPGVYVLRRRGVAGDRWSDPTARVGTLALGEYHVPARADSAVAVIHRPAVEVTAGEAVVIRAEVASTEPARGAQLLVGPAGGSDVVALPMRRTRGNTYQATVPAERVTEGVLEYAIRVEEGGRASRFPRGATGDSTWRVVVALAGSPIVLFDVARDTQRVLSPHPYRYVRFRSEVLPGSADGRRALRVEVESFEPDPHHYAVRSFLGEENGVRLASAGAYGVLRVRARSTGAAEERLEVALVDREGVAWGAVVPLTPQWRDVDVPISSLRPTPLALLPRPYPEFLPNEGPEPGGTGRLDLARVDGVQLRIGDRWYAGGTAPAGPHGFEIESVSVVRDDKGGGAPFQSPGSTATVSPALTSISATAEPTPSAAAVTRMRPGVSRRTTASPRPLNARRLSER